MMVEERKKSIREEIGAGANQGKKSSLRPTKWQLPFPGEGNNPPKLGWATPLVL